MIDLKNVSITLNERNIINDISLSFSKGITFLIGLNGSGKTTLLKAIAKRNEFRGEVLVNGRSVTAYGAKSLSRVLSIIDQRVFPFPGFRVIDFIQMGRFPYVPFWGNYTKKDIEIARNSAIECGLEEKTQQDISTLSGGEFQRALLARAITQTTNIILMDEPAQSLDPKAKVEIYSLIEKMKISGKNIICSTHDIEFIKNIQADFIGLRNGEIIRKGEMNRFSDEDWMGIYG